MQRDSTLGASEIGERIAAVRRRICDAASRTGRDPQSIVLVAVSKTVEPERVLCAYAEGVTDFGENRVQEGVEKISMARAKHCSARWHLIGHLQSNKARRAVEAFDVIQAVDSVALAERLNRLAGEAGRRIPILLEINFGEEESKSGFEVEELLLNLSPLAALAHLDCRGLMVIPPYRQNIEQGRPYFRRTREILSEVNRRANFSAPLTELSMGMSHDYQAAIEEGATIVRVGTAIFGPRPNVN